MQRRIISIGDLHGDFGQTSGILRRLGLTDEEGAWTGGRDVLIQTGGQSCIMQNMLMGDRKGSLGHFGMNLAFWHESGSLGPRSV